MGGFGLVNPLLDAIKAARPDLTNPVPQTPPILNPGTTNPQFSAIRAQTVKKPEQTPPPQIPPMNAPSVAPIGPSAQLSVKAPRGTIQGDEAERGRLMTTGSGISQIKNPFLHGLAATGNAIGGLLSPRLMEAIPGTQEHHNLLLGNANKALTLDEANAEKEAQTGNLQSEIAARPSEVALRGAQTEHEQAVTAGLPAEQAEKQRLEDAQITNLLHPQARTEFEAWRQENPNAPVADFLKLQAANKPTAQGNDFEQFYKDYIKDNNLPDSAHNRLMARKEYSAANQAPQRPPQITVVTPSGQVETLHPGQTMQPGSMSPTQLGSQNLAQNKATEAETKQAQAAQKDYQLMQTLAANPSPTNDLAMVMHYIGATKPDSLGKLRLNQNEIALVMGTRSSFGDLEAFGEKIANGQKLTPQQRQDMLSTMKILSDSAGGGKETREYQGHTYEKGADGQWHLQKPKTP